ncbi:hypothetical protein ACVTMO_06510 [Pseudomonas segetis]
MTFFNIGLVVILGGVAYVFGHRLFRYLWHNWLVCWKTCPADPQQLEPAKSKSAFRVARYLTALLWHWSIPFVFGCLAASVVSLLGIQQGLMQVTDVLDEALQQAVQACQQEQ